MKVAVCTCPGRIDIEERPTPAVDADSVLVRVAVCGVCGSDVAAWKGTGHKGFPHSPGHECCGTVAVAGNDVSDVGIGQRVVIDPNLACGTCPFCRMGRPNLCDRLKSRRLKSNGGMAEYVALDARMVYPLPDQMPDAVATLIEPLSCALHAVGLAEATLGQYVTVFGAGQMGFLTGLILKSFGIEPLLVEPSESRRDRAARILDLRAIAPSELDESDIVGDIPVAIDCSGSLEAVGQAIRVLRKAGRLVLAGLAGNRKNGAIPLMEVTVKELEVKGAWLNPDTFRAAIDFAAIWQDTLDGLETEVFALERAQEALVRASSPDAPRVLVRPRDGS